MFRESPQCVSVDPCNSGLSVIKFWGRSPGRYQLWLQLVLKPRCRNFLTYGNRSKFLGRDLGIRSRQQGPKEGFSGKCWIFLEEEMRKCSQRWEEMKVCVVCTERGSLSWGETAKKGPRQFFFRRQISEEELFNFARHSPKQQQTSISGKRRVGISLFYGLGYPQRAYSPPAEPYRCNQNMSISHITLCYVISLC